MTRHYSSVASEKELSSPIDNSTQTIPLNNVTGLPNEFPYTLILDHDTGDEEIINVTDAAGTNLTADRGVDGTVGLAHEQGAKVVHAITARDLQESRDHEDATTDAHGVGVANSVVGTSTVQTLEGKTIDGGDNTLLNIAQTSVTDLVGDQATQDGRLTTNEGNISSVTSDFSNHESATAAHGVGEIVGRTEAQVLSNKTLGSSTNISFLGSGWRENLEVPVTRFRAVNATEEANVVASSSNYLFVLPSVGVTYVAPPSGNVVVTIYVRFNVNDTSTGPHFAPSIRSGTSTGGAVLWDAADGRAIDHENGSGGTITNLNRVGMFSAVFPNHVPGQTYTAWLMTRVDGGSVDIFSRRIIAQGQL